MLLKEDLTFIDTYLKNSEVEFTDIRIEMVDHVASEIETAIEKGDSRGFYHIFKDYMIKNKAVLLKNNRRYYKSSDKKILKSVFRNTFSLKGLVIFLSVFFSLNILKNMVSQELFVQINKGLLLFVFIIAAILYRFFGRIKKERFSSIERIGLYFMVIAQLMNLSLQNLSISRIIYSGLSFRLIMISSFFIFMLLILTLVLFQLKKDYMLKYKSSIR